MSCVLRLEPEPVYPVEIEGDHSERVGEANLIVHNTKMSGQLSPNLMLNVNSTEVQAVKYALVQDDTDAGIGVLHLLTSTIHLRPSSQTTPVGHDALVNSMGLHRDECRGFVITLASPGNYVIENISGLNVKSGGPKPLQMPTAIFDTVRQALMRVGL